MKTELREEALVIKSGGGEGFSSVSTAAPTVIPVAVKNDGMTFGKAISTCMGKYASFDGRASRAEYWWFYLFTLLLSWGSLIVDRSGFLSAIVNLAIVLPSLSAAVRRLHDINRSGWWVLIAFTVIGLIPLIYWLSKKGGAQTNEYGSPVGSILV